MKILRTNDFFCWKTIIIHSDFKNLVITTIKASRQPLLLVPEHTPNPVELLRAVNIRKNSTNILKFSKVL